jgi:Polyketide cyclase / dehydrase and lipid transport
MPMNRCETRSISIAAPPSAVIDFVGDARTLPRWAPAFTRTVEAEGEHWRIDGGGLVDGGTAEEAVARQMAVVESELRAVRDACQV